jgi:hypothetical protein
MPQRCADAGKPQDLEKINPTAKTTNCWQAEAVSVTENSNALTNKNMNTQTNHAPPVDLDRLVLLLNEAYFFLGMRHKALHPWRVALDEWQVKVENETGWNHFAEVRKFERNKQTTNEP